MENGKVKKAKENSEVYLKKNMSTFQNELYCSNFIF